MIEPIELTPGSDVSLFKVVRVPQGGRKQIVFRLTDETGKPIKLKEEPANLPAEPPEFEGSKPLSALNTSIKLIARDEYGDHRRPIEVDGKILEGDCSLVEFNLDMTKTQILGVFRCEVGRFAGDSLVDTWPCYLEIAPTLFQSTSCRKAGPLTIPELRLELRDNRVGDVSLLDSLQFEDVEILHAIRSVIELWNETPPSVTRFTTANFPYRRYWRKGAIAELYKMAAHAYRRNALAYSAGGISIDDQNKSKEYEEIGEMLSQEFTTWMRAEKRQLNMRRAWRSGL